LFGLLLLSPQHYIIMVDVIGVRTKRLKEGKANETRSLENVPHGLRHRTHDLRACFGPIPG
jgi:hypothetical protein